MIFMSSPASSVIHIASAAAAAMLLLAGLAFHAGRGGDQASMDASPALPAASAVLADAPLPETFQTPVDYLLAPGIRPEPAPAWVADRPMLAVIIDDIGLDPQAAGALMELGVPLTLSILPFAADAPAISQAAAEVGLEVFLHMPMEPVGLDDPGPNALLRNHSSAEMARRMAWALARVPVAVGFNNHMGSAITADQAAMARFFAGLEGSGLVFVDSLTHPQSVAGRAAASAGLQSLRRDVFLDHVRTPAAVDAAIEEALHRARQNGSAIAIGHPHPATLAALQSLGERAEAAGVELVTVSQIAQAHARQQAS